MASFCLAWDRLQSAVLTLPVVSSLSHAASNILASRTKFGQPALAGCRNDILMICKSNFENPGNVSPVVAAYPLNAFDVRTYARLVLCCYISSWTGNLAPYHFLLCVSRSLSEPRVNPSHSMQNAHQNPSPEL